MDVSENSGTPKSSLLLGFSIINHPFWGTPILGNPHIHLEPVVSWCKKPRDFFPFSETPCISRNVEGQVDQQRFGVKTMHFPSVHYP